MAEITIRWNRNTPDGETRWDGMSDAVADAVADLLESFEQAETEGLPGQETDHFIAETHRLADSVTLAYRARRGKR
ncbi:MAG: hypothetical protein LUD72_01120 [Bacteroidales bacterium]|nr:hypothetical protein [Bacteroidales bacterium]